MTTHHAAVWLDHNEAHVFHITAETYDEATIHSPKAHTRLHNKAGAAGTAGHRAVGDPHYYHEIAAALRGSGEILVLGPATAKLELIRHIHKHDRELEPKIIGVETVDHPTDRQLVTYARRYFDAKDRAPVVPVAPVA